MLDSTAFRGVAHALSTTATVAADRVAVIQGETRLTYAELYDRALAIGAALDARGVRPGDVVAMALYNSPEYLQSLIGTLLIGAVPVNINYRYLEPELRYGLEYTGAKAFLYDAGMAPHTAGLTGTLPGLDTFVAVGSGPAPDGHVAGLDSLTAATEPGASAAAGLQPASSNTGIILLTGGTTGRPKGVVWDGRGLLSILSSVFTHRGMTAPTSPEELTAAVRELQDTVGAPVVLPMSPLIHGTGFFHAMRTLLGGGTVCFCSSRSLDADEVWQIVGRHGVTEMVIVGDAFGRPLVQSLQQAESAGKPYELSSLRQITSSGVAWSAEVKRELLTRGSMTLMDNISASEGGPFGVSEARTVADLADGRFALSSVARILDEHDRDIEAGTGQVGVLASAGPLPIGYLNDPERTARTWRTIDGVRYSMPGDLASLDADGKLVLLGRGDGVINTGGEKVFPEEVEQALRTHPAVADAVVVGVPHPRWGQSVSALVVLQDPAGEVPHESVTEHLNTQLARYKHPRALIPVSAVPRTPAGKINRSQARATATAEMGEHAR